MKLVGWITWKGLGIRKEGEGKERGVGEGKDVQVDEFAFFVFHCVGLGGEEGLIEEVVGSLVFVGFVVM